MTLDQIPKDYPWHTLSVDIMGPFSMVRQHRFIITCLHIFSGYCVLVNSADHTASTVNQVVTYFGVPTRILTDHGQEFVGYAWEQLMK